MRRHRDVMLPSGLSVKDERAFARYRARLGDDIVAAIYSDVLQRGLARKNDVIKTTLLVLAHLMFQRARERDAQIDVSRAELKADRRERQIDRLASLRLRVGSTSRAIVTALAEDARKGARGKSAGSRSKRKRDKKKRPSSTAFQRNFYET